MRTKLWMVIILCLAGVTARANVFSMSGSQTSITFALVGDVGNSADANTYGSVSYSFSIANNDVTLAQYRDFLNAVAVTDAHGVYTSVLSTSYSTQGIARTGSPGSYSYSVTGSNPKAVNCPVFAVTWGDAARFSNWLVNGQPTGAQGPTTTERGAYTLDGATSDYDLMQVTRRTAASYCLPNRNEFHKAAYYRGGSLNAGYWLYGTSSMVAPGNSLVKSVTHANNANYNHSDAVNLLTAVGQYTATISSYDAWDMSGNVSQWNEYTSPSKRFRSAFGGNWTNPVADMSSSAFIQYSPNVRRKFIGFRVVKLH